MSKTEITFKECASEQLVDAFTGGPLSETVYKCQECSVRYNESSVSILVKENDGRCLSCGKCSILIE